MDAPSIRRSIETANEENWPFGKRIKLFGYPLKLVAAEKLPLGHVHPDRFGEREVRELIFRHARKGGGREFGDILSFAVTKRQRQTSALAGVLHHRQLHLHARQTKAHLARSICGDRKSTRLNSRH